MSGGSRRSSASIDGVNHCDLSATYCGFQWIFNGNLWRSLQEKKKKKERIITVDDVAIFAYYIF